VVDKVVTDSSWTVSDGPIRQDSTYYGELYDANFEQAGWNKPGFVPTAAPTAGARAGVAVPPRVANVAPRWVPATTNFGVVAHLSSQAMQPITRVHLIKPLTMDVVHINGTTPNCQHGDENVPVTAGCTDDATITSVTFAAFGTLRDNCAANGTIAAGPYL
jgi:hypothetical protein